MKYGALNRTKTELKLNFKYIAVMKVSLFKLQFILAKPVYCGLLTSRKKIGEGEESRIAGGCTQAISLPLLKIF